MKSSGSDRKNQEKQPYSSPKLTVYGDLRLLTRVKGGNQGEIGGPSTMLPGG